MIKLIRMLLDLLLVVAAFGIGLVVYHAIGIGEKDPRVLPYIYLALFAGTLYVSIFNWMGLYGAGRSSLTIAETKRLFDAYVYGALILTAVTFFSRVAQADPPSRLVLVYSLTAGFPLLRLGRFASRVPLALLQNLLGDSKHAVIVGANDLGRQLHRALRRTPSPQYSIAGFVSCSDTAPAVSEGPVIGTLGDIERLLDERRVDCLFVAGESIPRELMFQLRGTCEARRIEFCYVPDLFELVTHDVRTSELDGIPLMTRRVRGRRRVYLAGKRVFDIVFSALALAVLAIPFAVLAMLVKRDSPGPVFFSHERIGRNGKRFRLFKFRTMRQGYDAYLPSPKTSDDPRVTRLGRFLRRSSIDELPQLFNILKGEMSVVGPRPEMPFIVEKYTPAHRLRLQAKPGLTGVWQISAHRGSDIHDVMDYDLYYIENQSFVLDMLIILETFFYVISGRGGC